MPLGFFPSHPVPLGFPARIRVEQGDLYGVPDFYELEITVLEAYLGKKAWKKIETLIWDKTLLSRNQDYVLVFLRATLIPYSTTSGRSSYKLTEDQFFLTTKEAEYKPSRLSLELEQGILDSSLHDGETKAGWIAFEVPRRDQNVLLLYAYKPPGAAVGGRFVWFEL